MCFCPFCGSKLPRIIWSKSLNYLPPTSEVTCKRCKRLVLVEDRALIDQEGTVEVIFH